MAHVNGNNPRRRTASTRSVTVREIYRSPRGTPAAGHVSPERSRRALLSVRNCVRSADVRRDANVMNRRTSLFKSQSRACTRSDGIDTNAQLPARFQTVSRAINATRGLADERRTLALPDSRESTRAIVKPTYLTSHRFSASCASRSKEREVRAWCSVTNETVQKVSPDENSLRTGILFFISLTPRNLRDIFQLIDDVHVCKAVCFD